MTIRETLRGMVVFVGKVLIPLCAGMFIVFMLVFVGVKNGTITMGAATPTYTPVTESLNDVTYITELSSGSPEVTALQAYPKYKIKSISRIGLKEQWGGPTMIIYEVKMVKK